MSGEEKGWSHHVLTSSTSQVRISPLDVRHDYNAVRSQICMEESNIIQGNKMPNEHVYILYVRQDEGSACLSLKLDSIDI